MNYLNNRAIGTDKEIIATKYLIDNGAKILETNFHYHRNGEIDIVAMDAGYLVFAEVKYRKNKADLTAENAVNYKKMRTICRCSDYYRLMNNLSDDMPVRYDVIAIYDDEIRWYKNAFEYIGM